MSFILHSFKYLGRTFARLKGNLVGASLFTMSDNAERIEVVNLLSRTFLENYLSSDTDQRSKCIRTYIKEAEEIGAKVEDFKRGLEWVNTKEPLLLKKDLKGKIVILDFFTYCCINCMHILPGLKILENQFTVEDGLVVVGVHSPKFSNEKQTANVTAAVERYEITHPVVNDPEETTWRSLNVCCWPTLVVIGPEGQYLLQLMGEGHTSLLQSFVKEAIEFYKKKDLMSTHDLPQVQAFQHSPPTSNQPLLYPGKVVWNDGKLAVADTGFHRVLILDSSGKVEHVIGGTDSGFIDGSLSEAKFHSPQGIAFKSSDLLYLADTENHAIREINLKTRQVKTVAGTGKQGKSRSGGNLWSDQEINSPWDLCIVDEKDALLIAMAGTHQIWALFLENTTWWKNKEYKKGTCVAIAGSGREENRNNSYPMSSAFAQPSGLAFAPSLNCVFVADSESSTIRRLMLSDGAVKPVVGGHINPQNLFAFGDTEGKRGEAKLQHPLGVAWNENKKVLYVADTYNHKVKCIDPNNDECTNLLDYNSKPFKLNEPSGLYVAGELIYVADTNNHRIAVINLESKKIDTLKIELPEVKLHKGFPVVHNEKIEVLSKDGEINLKAEVSLPSGTSLTPDAPSRWTVNLPSGGDWSIDEKEPKDFNTTKEWKLEYKNLDSTESKIIIDCVVYYCVGNLCSSQKFSFCVCVSINNSASKSVSCNLKYKMP